MNFLEICQEVRDRTGISRYGLPATVVGQVGQIDYLVDNVVRSDLFIQRLHSDWQFLFAENDTIFSHNFFFPLKTPTSIVWRLSSLSTYLLVDQCYMS